MSNVRKHIWNIEPAMGNSESLISEPNVTNIEIQTASDPDK